VFKVFKHVQEIQQSFEQQCTARCHRFLERRSFSGSFNGGNM